MMLWILQSYFLQYAFFIVIVRAEVLNTITPTVKKNFSCYNRPMGFYADIEANCKIYYTCDYYGNKFTYQCPEETAFRQDALICDHAHLVDCQATTHLSTRVPNENIEENVYVTPSMKSPVIPTDSVNNHRLSFSRSFQVIRQPDASIPNKLQSGFVFSASLFLKDQSQMGNQAEKVTDICTKCNTNSKNRMKAATTRAYHEQFNFWDSPNSNLNLSKQSLSLPSSKIHTFAQDESAMYLNHSFEMASNSSPTRMIASQRNQYSSSLHEELPLLNYNSNNHPYSETLRSIQASAYAINMKSTTEIPVHTLTHSLKPLVPNELEYDPYYPKQPTSTDAYYTPRDRNKVHTNILSTSQAPPVIAHHKLSFEIPSILPDLNTLKDLVDRRKFFYIPRANIKTI